VPQAWGDAARAERLSVVTDPLARNLLGQMLHPDPRQRPSLARVYAHPFLRPALPASLSEHATAAAAAAAAPVRLVCDAPMHDVYLSYRRGVPGDQAVALLLARLLEERGLTVCYEDDDGPGTGNDTGKGDSAEALGTEAEGAEGGPEVASDAASSDAACAAPALTLPASPAEPYAGLLRCRAVVTILSREATNHSPDFVVGMHPKKLQQKLRAAAAAAAAAADDEAPVASKGVNWGEAAADGPLDRLLFEQRLALELVAFGTVEKVLPVLVRAFPAPLLCLDIGIPPPLHD